MTIEIHRSGTGRRGRGFLAEAPDARRPFLAILPLFLVLSCSRGLCAGDVLDRSSLIKLIEAAAQPACQDVAFEYESKEIVPGPIERESLKLGPDGVQYIYTGTIQRRSDGANRVDIYFNDKQFDRSSYGCIATLKGVVQTSTNDPGKRNARINIKQSPDPISFAERGNYRSIWMDDWVVMLANSAYLCEVLGYKQLDGKECLVVVFRLVVDDKLPREKQISYTFWIDLARGANVVRFEQHWGGDLAELTSVRLDRFPIGKGQVVWLPISGRMESRIALRDGVRKFLDEPVYYVTYAMIPVTIRLNQGLKDSDFTVSARPGDAVSDEVRRAKFEYGQYRVRSKAGAKVDADVEVKAELDRMLEDKSIMAKELIASSPVRDGSGPSAIWPWAVAGLALAGLCFLLYRSRKP